MEPIILGDLSGRTVEEVEANIVNCWEHPAGFGGLQLLIAYEGYSDYEGDAFYLMKDVQTGEFYEVNGGHCSCYGFEGQWEPESTTAEAIISRRYLPIDRATLEQVLS